ncbi:MAG: DUF692 domain-containing protein [Pseudomonadales bacterium]
MPVRGLPASGGVSLKPEYFSGAAALLEENIWFEVHPENYMIEGGPRLKGLMDAAARFPISFHGVGASLGGPTLTPTEHIRELGRLIERVEPASISEHAVWSGVPGQYFAELLPLPRTREAMWRLVDGIDYFQEMLGRSILIENPSNYLPFISEMDEPEFLNEVAKRTGCGLLLDVNNVFVSSNNCGIDPQAYIRTIDRDLVGEIHVAGHTPDEIHGSRLLIDSHAAPVAESVWHLLDVALDHLGPVPVLIERDANLPAFEELLEEKRHADRLLFRACQHGGVAYA